MTTPDEQAQARLILGLLLDGDRVGVERIDWDTLLPLARNNGVLIRLAERLAEQGVAPPAAFAESVARERQRVRDAFTLVRQVSRICVTHGIQFLSSLTIGRRFATSAPAHVSSDGEGRA